MNLVGMRPKKEGGAIIKINQICAASKDGGVGVTMIRKWDVSSSPNAANADPDRQF